MFLQITKQLRQPDATLSADDNHYGMHRMSKAEPYPDPTDFVKQLELMDPAEVERRALDALKRWDEGNGVESQGRKSSSRVQPHIGDATDGTSNLAASLASASLHGSGALEGGSRAVKRSAAAQMVPQRKSRALCAAPQSATSDGANNGAGIRTAAFDVAAPLASGQHAVAPADKDMRHMSQGAPAARASADAAVIAAGRSVAATAISKAALQGSRSSAPDSTAARQAGAAARPSVLGLLADRSTPTKRLLELFHKWINFADIIVDSPTSVLGEGSFAVVRHLQNPLAVSRQLAVSGSMLSFSRRHPVCCIALKHIRSQQRLRFICVCCARA
jgi:hypothetical protein